MAGPPLDVVTISPTGCPTMAFDLEVSRIALEKNFGPDIGPHYRINLIEGPGITINITEDILHDRFNVTFTASGVTVSGISGVGIRTDFGPTTVPRPVLNFISGANIHISAVDNSIADEVDITITASGTSTVVSGISAQANFGPPQGPQPLFNFIATSGVSIVVINDPSNESVDIALGASGVVPGGAAGGDLAGHYPDPLVVAISGVAYNADPLTQYVRLYGRSDSLNNPTLSTDSDGTLRGSGAPGFTLHLGSDTGIPGVHIQRNFFGTDRMIVGPNIDPTTILIPSGILDFLVVDENQIVGATMGIWAAGSSSGGTLFGIQGRGTATAPAPSQDEDVIFAISAFGTDASGESLSLGESAKIAIGAKPPGGVPITGYVPAQLGIQTRDASGILATRIEIHSDGSMSFGDSSGFVFDVSAGGTYVSLPLRTNANEQTGRGGSMFYNTDVNTFRGVVAATKVTFITDDGAGNVTIPGNVNIQGLLYQWPTSRGSGPAPSILSDISGTGLLEWLPVSGVFSGVSAQANFGPIQGPRSLFNFIPTSGISIVVLDDAPNQSVDITIGASGVVPGGAAGGDLAGVYPDPILSLTGVTPGTYGDVSHVGQFTVDEKGRLIAASNITISGASSTASGIFGQANFGPLQGPRPTFNFIAVSGLAITVVDDPANNSVDVSFSGIATPTPTAPASGVFGETNFGPIQGPQPTINFIPTSGVSVVVINDQPNASVDVAIGASGVVPGGAAGGDLAGVYPDPILSLTGVTPGTYGDPTHVGQFTVDAKGRIDSAQNVPISGLASGIFGENNFGPPQGPQPTINFIPTSGVSVIVINDSPNSSIDVAIGASGVVPGGAAGGDLAGVYPDPILSLTGVVPGLYGDATHVGQFIVDAKGRIDSAQNTTISGLASGIFGEANFGPLRGPRPTFNFIPTSGVSVVVIDDSPNNSVDIALGASGVVPGGAAGGDLAGIYPDPVLSLTGVTPGTYGDSAHVGQFVVDAKGRIDSAQNIPISGLASGIFGENNFGPRQGPQSTINFIPTSGVSVVVINDSPNSSIDVAIGASGVVPGGAAGGDLAGVYPDPVLSLTGVTPGRYGDSTHIGQFVVDAKGRIDSAQNISISGLASGIFGQANFGPLQGPQPIINFIPTSGVSVVVINDSPNSSIDVALGASGVVPGGAAGGDLAGTYPDPILTNTGVVAGIYGDSTHVGQFIVDAKGRIDFAKNATISGLASGIFGEANSGPLKGPRPTFNFIAVSGISISVTDDPANNSVDVSLSGIGVVGIGIPTQVSFWSSPTTIAGDPNFVWDNINKALQIGPITPNGLATLQVSHQGDSIIQTDAYGGGSTPIFSGRDANGTATSPTASIQDDGLVQLQGIGFGTIFTTKPSAAIEMLADENFTDSAKGARIVFETTTKGTTTLRERMRIGSSGNVGIGGTSLTSLFNVGSADQFQVDSAGNLAKIRAVAYASWPTALDGAFSLLADTTGTGALAWLPVSGIGGIGQFWKQGGNAFSALGVLGTLDANDLTFITNGSERARIKQTGGMSIGTTVDPGNFNLLVSGIVTASGAYIGSGKACIIDDLGQITAKGAVHNFGTAGIATSLTVGQGTTGTDTATLTINSGNSGAAFARLILARNTAVAALFNSDGTNTTIGYTGTLQLAASLIVPALNINSSGAISKYDGVNTAGLGVPAVYGYGRSTGQTGAVASVATYTPTADGSFVVSANVLVTTATSHAFTVTCTYHDEGNTARTLTMPFTLVAGSAIVTSVANANGTVPYMGIPLHIRVKANTSITIATTGTFTTVTYNVEGTIKQEA